MGFQQKLPLLNLNGTAAPNSADDIKYGYEVGSEWKFGLLKWTCTSNTANNAVWVLIGGSTLTEITDSTRRTLLSNATNWDAGNNYIGTAITGSAGDYYIDATYLYQLFNKTTGSTTVLTVERAIVSGVLTDPTYTITCNGTTEVYAITNLLNNQNFEATLWYTDSADTTIPSGGRRLQTVYRLDATDSTITVNLSGINETGKVYTLYTIGRGKAPVSGGGGWVDSGWVDSGWVN